MVQIITSKSVQETADRPVHAVTKPRGPVIVKKLAPPVKKEPASAIAADSPSDKFHGAQMIAFGYTWQPRCTFAPNARSNSRLQRWNGRGLGRNRITYATPQRARALRLPNEKLGPVYAEPSSDSGD